MQTDAQCHNSYLILSGGVAALHGHSQDACPRRAKPWDVVLRLVHKVCGVSLGADSGYDIPGSTNGASGKAAAKRAKVPPPPIPAFPHVVLVMQQRLPPRGSHRTATPLRDPTSTVHVYNYSTRVVTGLRTVSEAEKQSREALRTERSASSS